MEHPIKEPKYRELEAQREVEWVEHDDPRIQIVRVCMSHAIGRKLCQSDMHVIRYGRGKGGTPLLERATLQINGHL